MTWFSSCVYGVCTIDCMHSHCCNNLWHNCEQRTCHPFMVIGCITMQKVPSIFCSYSVQCRNCSTKYTTCMYIYLQYVWLLLTKDWDSLWYCLSELFNCANMLCPNRVPASKITLLYFALCRYSIRKPYNLPQASCFHILGGEWTSCTLLYICH